VPPSSSRTAHARPGPTASPARLAAGAACLALALIANTAIASEADDAYIRGYVASLLRSEFGIAPGAVGVVDGVVTIRADLPNSERERLLRSIGEVEGVRSVEIEHADTDIRGFTWLPGRSLFVPLIADPRWPRFSAAYQHYFGDGEIDEVAAVSFGEALPIVRYAPPWSGEWELGLQGGVFAIFDLASDSFDLINADYFVAIPLSYAQGNFSGIFRFFHQSSHLGDEYLLRSRVERVNLSYEAINLLLSYELPLGFRVYGGSSYLIRTDPSDILPWRFQTGLEFTGPSLAKRFMISPLAAIDVQIDQEGGWVANVAPSVGVQFEGIRSQGRNFQLLVQYFYGRSPNGQFYERRIEYVGLVGQFHF
jgi:hypothetical protein